MLWLSNILKHKILSWEMINSTGKVLPVNEVYSVNANYEILAGNMQQFKMDIIYIRLHMFTNINVYLQFLCINHVILF